MSSFAAIVLFGVLMSAIALVGSLTLTLPAQVLERILLYLVAFASGALIGGALFHMLPHAVQAMPGGMGVWLWTGTGFLVFLLLEHLLQWHHCHRPPGEHRQPLTYLILLADGLHNLIGGLSIGALFVADVRLGITAWIAAAAHEVPQELGDFGVLVHGGWGKRQALLFNFLSGLTFLVGGLLAYWLSMRIDVRFLVPFAAGNFLYIGAVDLIPEFKQRCAERLNLGYVLTFVLGMGVILLSRSI